jgi:tellurite resistance protein TerC
MFKEIILDTQLAMWIGFHVFVIIMLALDLGVFHKDDHVVSVKESIVWTGVWIMLALLFNVGVYYYIGHAEASEFLTAYVLEKSLSVDNIFVMTIIFSYFKVDPKYQHRVLFWGILGALVMRIVFILAGVAIIERFHFVLYFFGAFLIYTGIKMLFSHGDEEVDPTQGFMYKFCKKHFRLTDKYDGHNFFTTQNGVRYMTPLFLVLLIIESTDLIFAVDSIPATLSVTKNSFIAYTSNIFAILGLRSLYFAFAGVVRLFRFLSYALSIVLIFIGVKMLIESFYKIPTAYSLGIVLGTILLSVILSLLFPEKEEPTKS